MKKKVRRQKVKSGFLGVIFPALTLRICAFCAHSVLLCNRVLQYTAIIFVSSDNGSVFVMEAQCVFYESVLDNSVACSVIRVTFMFRGIGVTCVLIFLKCFLYLQVYIPLLVVCCSKCHVMSCFIEQS